MRRALLAGLPLVLALSPVVAAPDEAQAPRPFEITVLGETVAPAEVEKERGCALGSPTGDWTLATAGIAGEGEGADSSALSVLEARSGAVKQSVRVYRMSGPCWAPDGSYFVFGEGGIVKAAAPGLTPSVLWQDPSAPRGGIFPARVMNFRWGTAMRTLSFLYVDDPAKENPSVSLVTLTVK